MKHKYIRPLPRCPVQKKAMFRDERSASQAMMRVWSHDSSMNIYKYHTYQCPHCGFWHFGNATYFKPAQSEQASTVV